VLKKTVFALLLTAFLSLQADQRSDDLKAILHQLFWTKSSDTFLNMQVAEAVLDTNKMIDADLAILRVKIAFDAKMAQLAPYWSVFSDPEIHEIRSILENPVYQKYSQFGNTIFQNSTQVLKDLFKEEVNQNGLAANTNFTSIIELTQANFQDQIDRATKPIIVKIYSNGCHVCRLMSTIFEPLSEDYKGAFQFASINWETENALARSFDVSNLPTFLVFRPGQKTPYMKFVGFLTKKEFASRMTQIR
jgi:thioredoxin 1